MSKKKFRSYIGLATLLFGITIYWLLSLPLTDFVIVGLRGVSKEVASVLSSYAFTIAGFLATIVTFLYTLGDRPYFKLYKTRGSFGDFMFIFFLELLMLSLLFAVAIGLIAWPELMRLALTLLILSLACLAFLVLASFNLTRRTEGE